MNGQFANNIFIKKSNLHVPSSLTEIADDGVVRRMTPLSLIKENKFNMNHYDNGDNNEQDDNETISTFNQTISHDLIMSNKPRLKYKKCLENTRYSSCLITYIDHPSAVFLQLLEHGLTFQQMHQNLNRLYMDHLNAYSHLSIDFYAIGDFCVAYSSQYFEFFRARIINIDHRNKQYLVIYVDFGNSEWIHPKSLRPLHIEFTRLEVQGVPVTLSHIVPKKDLKTGTINWSTTIGKQCTRQLRRLLIKPDSEPLFLVSVTFVSNENWWPLPFVNIEIDSQDLATILQNDGYARLIRDNNDLRMIYPNFGSHSSELIIFGIPSSLPFANRYL